jgi:hypothetical protein
MVMSSARRKAKYSAKSVGDVVKNRFDAQKDEMTSNFSAAADLLVGYENTVKGKLNGWGVYPQLHPSYYNFMRECFRITNTHGGIVAHDEICIAATKWAARGLLPYYLQVIAQDVFTVDISDCT